MSNNAHELSNRLLNALDNNYNVVDMHAVNEIISILEKINITKELLETTRLGKHVNELRRKTSDPTLARRAKVLVKRWRDLVIPSVASPGNTGSNRSSAERQVRRLGGTPLTSPALSRVVSPAVNSPRPPSRPAWGGYESDSQDVILVDDEPSPAPAPSPALLPPPPAHKPLTPPVKRASSPVPIHDEKKAKRDKKPKKKRGHSRAGSGADTAAGSGPVPGPTAPVPSPGPVPPAAGAAWPARNGSAAPDRRRNGYKRDKVDPYAALVNRMPPAGAKKVKTTKELLEEIQSRGRGVAASPSPPNSPDVMLIEPDPCPVKVESPLRNGDSEPRVPSPVHSPLPPLEDERPYYECTCDGAGSPADGAGSMAAGSLTSGSLTCPAGYGRRVRPRHVHALHHTLVPGVNGTRAPPLPHRFAVRKPEHPDWPGLFASVVPLYKYSDYADDYCVKNMSNVPICTHLPWTEFAPAPPSPPPLPDPPSPRPYPVEDSTDIVKTEPDPPPPPDIDPIAEAKPIIKIEPQPVSLPVLEQSERLKPPILNEEDEIQFGKAEILPKLEIQAEFKNEIQEHRTVERTKIIDRVDLDGRALVEQCDTARSSIPWDYEQMAKAPEFSFGIEIAEEEEELALETALVTSAESMESADPTESTRDSLGRPLPPQRFSEWHECAKLGDLIALPYVVID
ncbi:hypothetical protein evm_007009 [Chilo suppressalis]|nr:hypothetical protein evm_007009 [Chilo suppressalis]